MSNEHYARAEHRASQPRKPQQFSLSDLFAIVTLAALVFAMAAPFLREMQSDHVARLIAVTGVQTAPVAGAIAVAATRRRKLLQMSGRRIGTAYCGEGRWRHWPLDRRKSCCG